MTTQMVGYIFLGFIVLGLFSLVLLFAWDEWEQRRDEHEDVNRPQ